MVVLALQFACQPLLTQAFAPTNIVKSSYVLAQELARLLCASFLLVSTGSWSTATAGWSWRARLPVVGFPSLLYVIQSYCSLMAYQNLSPITYNVLNQTKTLSAAIFCFFLLGQAQSPLQVVSLFILLLSALVMEDMIPLPFLRSTESLKQELNEPETVVSEKKTYFLKGIVPILSASLISGLAGAWVQRSVGSYNSILFSLELSVVSILLLGLNTARRELISVNGSTDTPQRSWTQGWTLRTWIPVITNALGGITVGLVTKYAGAVRKGFALIVGVFLSGVLQNVVQPSKRVQPQQWVGGALAALSLWMHARFPPV